MTRKNEGRDHMYLNEGITDAAVTGFRKGFNAGMGLGAGFIKGAYSGTKRHIRNWTDPRNRYILPAKVAALATTPIVPFVSGGLSAGIGMRSGYRGEDYDKAIDKFNTGLDKRYESELNTMHRMKKPKSDLQRKWMNWNESSVLRNAYSISAVINEDNDYSYDLYSIINEAEETKNPYISGKKAEEVTKNLYEKITHEGMFWPRQKLAQLLKWLNKKAFEFNLKVRHAGDKAPFWKRCLKVITDCIEWVTRKLHNLVSDDKNQIEWKSNDSKYNALGMSIDDLRNELNSMFKPENMSPEARIAAFGFPEGSKEKETLNNMRDLEKEFEPGGRLDLTAK